MSLKETNYDRCFTVKARFKTATTVNHNDIRLSDWQNMFAITALCQDYFP